MEPDVTAVMEAANEYHYALCAHSPLCTELHGAVEAAARGACIAFAIEQVRELPCHCDEYIADILCARCAKWTELEALRA